MCGPNNYIRKNYYLNWKEILTYHISNMLLEIFIPHQKFRLDL